MKILFQRLLALGLGSACLAGCCTDRAPAGSRTPSTTERSTSAADVAGAKPSSPKDIGRSAARSEASQPVEVLPAQIQFAVYEVTTNAERMGELDAKTLAAEASTAQGLAKALNRVGVSRILYAIDQPVNVYSETINIGAREAVITDSRVTQSGDKINSFRYENTGIVVRLTAKMPLKGTQRKSPRITLSVALSVLTPSTVEISPSMRASTIRKLSFEHQEVLVLSQPRVALLTSSTSTGQPSSASVYVVRYVFNPPIQ